MESEEFGEKVKKVNEQVENDLVKRGRMDEDIGSMMGWLDITEGINQGGKSVSKPVKEGDNVIISAKVKQMAGMDTMLTRCTMQDKEGEMMILIDERGCSVDRKVVGEVHNEYNEVTKVKEMFARVHIPKLGLSAPDCPGAYLPCCGV